MKERPKESLPLVLQMSESIYLKDFRIKAKWSQLELKLSASCSTAVDSPLWPDGDFKVSNIHQSQKESSWWFGC